MEASRNTRLHIVISLAFLLCAPFFNNELLAAAQVSSIITSDIFNQFLSKISTSGCEGNGFYTYDAFTQAAAAFNGFGTSGDSTVNARELAAFFAHVAHETGEGCYINEQNPSQDYCDTTSSYSCATGQSYYGRGPLQLTWNYNYGAAGTYLGFDGINNPSVVATDVLTSFKTAVWFWMINSSCHTHIVNNEDFGATIRDINSSECGGSSEAQDRINLYKSYCSTLNVDPGSSLNC